MRLTQQQIEHIKAVITAEFGTKAEVTLFGSRQKDGSLGGDIDLLVSSSEPILRPALVSAKLEAKIMQRIGLQKIDVLLSAPNLQEYPIHRIAAQGLRL